MRGLVGIWALDFELGGLVCLGLEGISISLRLL